MFAQTDATRTSRLPNIREFNPFSESISFPTVYFSLHHDPNPESLHHNICFRKRRRM
jgi:hypothetical protein